MSGARSVPPSRTRLPVAPTALPRLRSVRESPLVGRNQWRERDMGYLIDLVDKIGDARPAAPSRRWFPLGALDRLQGVLAHHGRLAHGEALLVGDGRGAVLVLAHRDPELGGPGCVDGQPDHAL